jgi:hypothetical protein
MSPWALALMLQCIHAARPKPWGHCAGSIPTHHVSRCTMTSGYELARGLPRPLRPFATRTRLEDLPCAYLAPTGTRLNLTAIVTFAPRRVGVGGPSRRTMVDIERTGRKFSFSSFSARCEQYYCTLYLVLYPSFSSVLFIDISDERLHVLVR